MAESPEDKDVDACIADIQAALDKLKGAQRKDVDDEDSDGEYKESKPAPKNLREAEQAAYTTVRMHRRRVRQAGRDSSGLGSGRDSGKPDPEDGLK